MFVRLMTIHEEIINFNSAEGHRKYVLQEVFINPMHVTSLKEDLRYVELFVKGMLPEGFSKNQKFTKISLNRGNMGEEFTAIGDVVGIAKKLNGE